MVTHSVVMTVYNRPVEVILRTLRGLLECDMEGTQVVAVNDGSQLPYNSIRRYVEDNFLHGIWYDMPDYEAWRIEDSGLEVPATAETTLLPVTPGSNNPARAFNQAVLLAEGEQLIVMSSDVLVPPRTMAAAKKRDFSEGVWTPYVEDTYGTPRDRYGIGLDGREYCGPNRLFPMPWFLGMSKSHLTEVGGWDEGYLKGLCYEDNDVVGRVALRTGRFIGDWSQKVYHQGHHQVAYMQDKPAIVSANLRNREYTMKKWGGIPFDREFTPFDVVRKMQRSGIAAHECLAKSGKLESVVAQTTGLLAVADATR